MKKKYCLHVWNGWGHGLNFQYELKVSNIQDAYKKIRDGWIKSSYGALAANPRRFIVIQSDDKEVCGVDDLTDPLIPMWTRDGWQHVSL